MMRLIAPVVPRLRRYARALLRNRAAADDLVQDCLERAVGRWHQRRDDGDTHSWLFTIVHNLAMNRLRQDARRGQHLSLESADLGGMARPADQESSFHHKDVIKALARLPDEQRAVLLLVGVEDLSYADAARALGVPVGTVMSRLSRARARLRSELAGHETAAPHLRIVK